MADVGVVHGDTVMASAVVVGSSADLGSADYDFSKVTTNLPSMAVPSTNVIPGLVVILHSLVPHRQRYLTTTTMGE